MTFSGPSGLTARWAGSQWILHCVFYPYSVSIDGSFWFLRCVFFYGGWLSGVQGCACELSFHWCFFIGWGWWFGTLFPYGFFMYHTWVI